MGPQHPSTHGVLRLQLELDGETITWSKPDIGYLHTGIEKEFEAKTYHQGVTLTDRIDYLAPLSNNLCYALAVEKLMQIEIPEHAQWARVMLAELTRLNSHLVWLGTHAIDIGAMSVFLYCFREREEILRIFEMCSGQRMMTSYIRPGGLALALPRGWQQRVKKFIDIFPSRVDEYEDLLTNNKIWIGRTKGVGYHFRRRHARPRRHRSHAARRGRGLRYAQDAPYSSYEKFDFEVPTRTENDVYARYLCRLEEMRQSAKDHPAGRSKECRPGVTSGRCAEHDAARSRKDEDADGSAHLSFQDRDRRLSCSGRRGVPGDRIAARRGRLLHGQRRHGEAVSLPCAGAQFRQPAGRAEVDRRNADRRRDCGHRQYGFCVGRL